MYVSMISIALYMMCLYMGSGKCSNCIVNALFKSTYYLYLTTGAVGHAIDLVCKRTGVRHKNVSIDLPITGPKQVMTVTE